MVSKKYDEWEEEQRKHWSWLEQSYFPPAQKFTLDHPDSPEVASEEFSGVLFPIDKPLRHITVSGIENILAAAEKYPPEIQAIILYGCSVLETSQYYEIPRSTLTRRVAKAKKELQDRFGQWSGGL